MKRFILMILGVVSAMGLAGQTAPGKYWVQFTDKNNSPYSIDRPGEFLSARSIERRDRYSVALSLQDIPVNPAYIDSVRARGGIILNRSKWFNAVTVSATDTIILQNIRSLPFVRQIKSVGRFKGTGTVADKFASQITLAAETFKVTDTTVLRYGEATRQIGMLNGHILHNQGFQGQGMVIAILDGGFRNVNINPGFDTVRNNTRILGTWDFVRNQPVEYNGHAHGAQVMSIMAGNLPGRLVGSAPKASYYLLITEDPDTEFLIEEDNWISGAEYADSAGADLINSSLGYSVFDIPAMNHTYADMDGNSTRVTQAADIAASKGILVVCSAANEGNNPWHYITAPADADSILTVGSVDSTGIYSKFSSTGPTYDKRIKPNVTGQGTESAFIGTDGRIYRGSGTSFSSPLLCGLAACLWQTNRSVPPMKIIEAIQSSASRASQPDSLYGYGLPDFGKALFLVQGMNPISMDEESLFRLYPNPFGNKLHVDFYSPDRQEIRIELITLTGQILFSKKAEVGYTSVNSIAINEFNNLDDGMYIVRILTRTGKHEQRVMHLSGR
jgi:hypothetical protein